MGEVILKPGREKSVLRRHPWVFSGAVERVLGEPAMGDTVLICDSRGRPLAQGAYSPRSNIRLRVWSWDVDEAIDRAFFRIRLENAINMRQPYRQIEDRQGIYSDAYRLMHAESDGIPGLIVDRYANLLVLQCLSTGVERWRHTIADLLLEVTDARNIYERSDADVRELEGLEPRVGVLRGADLPERLQIAEGALSFLVDYRQGHKTGFYLDQRQNRQRVAQLSSQRDVLDCFSYTGGFALSALVGDARSVIAVESSAEAVTLAKDNLALNRLPEDRVEWVEGDVFSTLRKLRDQGKTFDLIILDPPKFAPTASQAERASRGYKDINLLAFKLLRRGGLLITFSCSGGISAELFQKIVFGAALDAGVEAQVVERLFQGYDHPVALNFPEGAYLKGLVIHVK
jgi:23S rRNA (cytosine1962-C5)-methyltransferase